MAVHDDHVEVILGCQFGAGGGQPAFAHLGSLGAAAHQARFQREGEALAKLSHPNVLRVFEADIQGDEPFLVSEYIKGCPLSRLGLPLPWPQVLRIGLALAEGLQAAHDKGVLHRDLKPATVRTGWNRR